MEEAKLLNVAIVGGGPGAKAIIDMIFAEKLSQLQMKLIGLASTNPNGLGYHYAQERGISTSSDYRDLFKLKSLNMIIELTGREEVANEISLTKPQHVRLMDHVAARLFWDVFQIEEERIAERKRAEEALKKAHDELEQRVERRTAELARNTEQLKLELAKRNRVEEELRLTYRNLSVKANRLQAANEELSEYADIVSHDLKAPLRAIRNYSDFLREDLEGHLEAEQKASLDGLNRAVQQGEQLVNDLLEFSRVGGGDRSIENIDMDAFFRDCLASLDLPRDVEAVVADSWPPIESDRLLLQRISQNLMTNAVKFNRSTRKRVEIGWAAAGDEHCELFVRDNGIGIDPRHHKQIFRVFARLHARDEYEGTGLGLAIVKKAANKLGSSVRVESKPGEGSTFFVTLPRTQNNKKGMIGNLCF
jgi:signal transduction histidine kinase